MGEYMLKVFDKVYTKEDIIAQLCKMNIPRDRVVLMHSSLRLIGEVEGGAEALLDALIEYFTEEGGLFCVPTHTWAFMKRDVTLDMSDPITCLGAFSTVALMDGRGIRSQNPTHSMVVFGNRERALEFIKDEGTISSGTNPDSCYGKLYSEGGYVLLVGVGHNRNTYVHSVDEMLGVENRLTPEPRPAVVKLESGELITRMVRTHQNPYTADISARFKKFEIPFRYHGAIVDGFIGNAPAQCCDARIMKDVLERIYGNEDGIDPLCDEKEIQPKWYC